MPYSLQVFCRREQYEPSITFYGPQDSLIPNAATFAVQTAEALAYVVHNTATFSRWELFNSLGHKINEGPIAGVAGTQGNDVVDPKLFLLARKNVEGEAEKPSVMYTPFYGSAMVLDGELTASGVIAFNFMAAALLDLPFWNSDGLPIVSYTFRHLTRRKKVRRVL